MLYLDTAATSLTKPDIVYQRVIESFGNCANAGRSGHRLSVEAARTVYIARERIASFFGISDPLRVVFCCNCTDALNLAIHGSLSAGDHVITTSMEHNSILRPLNELTRRMDVKQTIIDVGSSGILDPDQIERSLTPQTKMLVVAHASNLTGILAPIHQLGKLCRKRDILLLVDAAQTAGCVPINVEEMHIDLLAAAGHKSLFGLQGTGLLYVGERAKLRECRQGGTGSSSSKPYQPDVLPDRYESGTLNLPGIISLDAGISFIQEIGIEAIIAHEKKITKLIIDGLSRIPGIKLYGNPDPLLRIPIVAFNIYGLPPTEVSQLLDREYEICTRPGYHCAPLAHASMGTADIGSVRVSAGLFNTEADISALIKAVSEIAHTAKAFLDKN